MLNSELENLDKEKENSIELRTHNLEKMNSETRNSETWDKEKENFIELKTQKLGKVNSKFGNMHRQR